jgi:hypothetical protein
MNQIDPHPTPAKILKDKARRMLSDGLDHSPAAIEWAKAHLAKPILEDLLDDGFTLEELSVAS